MVRALRLLMRANDGAAGVEYAMLVAIVAVAIAASAVALSTSVSTAFNTVVTSF